MKRDFKDWFGKFKESICDYSYYINFDKVYRNVDNIKVELNILNSLVGSKNIEQEFLALVQEYPKVLKCIPLLLAVREQEIYAIDPEGEYKFNFRDSNYTLQEYVMFMRKTGLFRLISERIVNNLVDYATGVEVGLDSNGRKNRGGHLMENLVESHLQRLGLVKDKTYFKELKASTIQKQWGIDLSAISNTGKTEKRFDFVVKKDNKIYAIEANFYAASGSKLNETARSYKNLAIEAKEIPNFVFIWITDGLGWKAARHNLEETFDVLDTMFCINDLENGELEKLIYS